MEMRETEDDERQCEADRLLAATIYLMSCHARSGCPRVACMVQHHLELIGRHAEAGDYVRDTCRRLAAAWEMVRASDERRVRERCEAAAAIAVAPKLH
ncbi:hypothetical protein BWI17_16155 [Betaproteobacteria bacterium GR16-43]|nr:hypothetical protein BWI17_16155 [Betaproteobacteria bacterium GR16-43]